MGSRASGSASSRLICSQYRFENAPDMSIARKVPRRARKTAVGEFVADSALEGDGFEPSVPHKIQLFLAAPVRSRNSPSATKTGSFVRGTGGSNPSPSSVESSAHQLFRDKGRKPSL